MAGRYDLTIDQGVSWELPITIKIDSIPFDLTDYSGRAQIRRHRRSLDVVATFTVEKANPPGTDGSLILSLSAEASSIIPAGETVSSSSSKYVYDLEIFTSGDADVKRILEGFVYIDPEVTRP